jgi:hypothetical protein
VSVEQNPGPAESAGGQRAKLELVRVDAELAKRLQEEEGGGEVGGGEEKAKAEEGEGLDGGGVVEEKTSSPSTGSRSRKRTSRAQEAGAGGVAKGRGNERNGWDSAKL